MTADTITFGVEIECYVPSRLVRNGTIERGQYHRGIRVAALGNWNAQSDGSLTDAPTSYSGVEFASPILRGADGLKSIKATCDQLKTWNAKVNDTCGLHVHIGWDHGRTNAELKRLANLVANFEKAIYASTGNVNRERGHYAAPISDALRNHNFERSGASGCGRHHSLNLNHNGTVEFRAFAGTIEADQIIAYVRLCVALVQKAVVSERAVKWAAKEVVETSPVYRKGLGQTQMTRLFYGLGWTKGSTPTPFGIIDGEDLPPIDASKRVLMKMAKAYDATIENERAAEAARREARRPRVSAPDPAPAHPAYRVVRWGSAAPTPSGELRLQDSAVIANSDQLDYMRAIFNQIPLVENQDVLLQVWDSLDLRWHNADVRRGPMGANLSTVAVLDCITLPRS